MFMGFLFLGPYNSISHPVIIFNFIFIFFVVSIKIYIDEKNLRKLFYQSNSH
jgi:hypothetical protein